jgi:mRNA interferase RelE/StbE
MRYSLNISERALMQLRALPKDVRRNIGMRLELLCENLQGDVLKLKPATNRYRLRVGSFRILFTLEGNQIQVYAVKDRKEAYE